MDIWMPSCLAHLPLPSRESTYRTVMHVFNFKDYVLYGTVVTTERLQTRETSDYPDRRFRM